MELLQPSSLRIHASWDGDISHAAKVCVTVEVETKPNSRLLLLNSVKNTGLSHSMVWRIGSLGQEVPTVDVTDSKSILAHQIDYIPPSPPRKLFASSRGYRDEYGIAEKPDSFFEDWLSTHDVKETLDDQASAGSEPKQEPTEESAINAADTEEPLDDQASTVSEPKQEVTEETPINTADTADMEELSDVLRVDETSEHSLSEQMFDRWTDMDRSIEQYFDDSFLDLPPSPTPSSQDLIPWTSTKEIMNRLKAEQERDPLSVSAEVIVAPPPRDPGVVHENGQMFLDFPGSVEAKIYRVDIHCVKHVRERQDKWLELDLSQIGAACPEVQGLFVFETPWECEFSNPALGNIQAANGRLEYHFSPHGLQTMAFRQRENEDCTRMPSNDETHITIESEQEDISQDIQGRLQQIPHEYLLDTHITIESKQEDTSQDIQDRQQKIPDEPLQSFDETKFIESEMPSFKASGLRRTTWRISREFSYRFLGYFFIAMVVLFTAMGGPPEAISTPSNTLSTLRSVASDVRRHGSSMQTVIMDTFRDAQLRHGWHVYRVFWMDSLMDEETDLWTQKSAICRPADILMQVLAPICPLTEEMDVPEQDSVPADALTGETTASLKESATAGFPTEGIDTHEALATSTTALSTGNGSITTKKTGGRYKSTWSSIGRSILSRVGCSTSAHCIMAAAAKDDDPQWEVFERYLCDANNIWLAWGFKDRIDDILGWRPCEMKDLGFL